MMAAVALTRARELAAVSRRDVESEVEGLLRLDDEEACELLLVRHAEPADCGPADDPLLSCNGLVQAERLGERLRSQWVETIYTAPERRAVQTALVASEMTGRPLVTLEELRDIDFAPSTGEHESTCGQSYAHRFYLEPRWDSLPGFTSGKAFRRRAVQAIESVVGRHTGRRVAIVAHASVINAYLSMLLTVPRDLFFAPEHASVSIVRSLGDLYAVRTLNDTSHLNGSIHEL
ncbi:MAG TPA: histidine phosphatase family protein [Dehalococcoidia bacterium]|nr:histidine phosphatase family protein [Dehalococcoidia bacterium]